MTSVLVTLGRYTLGARALSFIAMVDAKYGPSLRQSASELSQARHGLPLSPYISLDLPCISAISPLYLRLRAEPGGVGDGRARLREAR